MIRIHAEFQLNEPPRLPFWFTPSQLTGELVMQRDGAAVESFHMTVPSGIMSMGGPLFFFDSFDKIVYCLLRK